MTRTTSLALLTGFALLIGGNAQAGPPTLCHPLEIGDAVSIPFGGDAFERGDLAATEVVGRTLQVLDASADAIVHQETLRRAYVYLGYGRQSHPRELSRLTDALKDRVLAAEAAAEPLPHRQRALRWLDLSVHYRLINEDRFGDSTRERWAEVHQFMSKALDLDPGNGGLALCAALGNVLDVGAGHEVRFLKCMQVALTQARQEGGLLERNALLVLSQGAARNIDRTSAEKALAGVEQALAARKT